MQTEIHIQGFKYRVDKVIGEGSSAKVYRAVNSSRHSICVKIINAEYYNRKIGKKLIDNEIDILASLSSPFILKFYKKSMAKDPMIITEYCEGGNLFNYLKKKRTLAEDQCVGIMKQLVEGCIYLHNRNILHRDLKPENIFIQNGCFKIADFGFAARMTDQQLLSLNVGSPLYMPLESLTDSTFTKKSDVFSIGVIWYELLMGKTPFCPKSQKDLKEKLQSDFKFEEPSCKSQTAKIIYRCLSKNASQRPSIQDLKHFIDKLNHSEKNKSISAFKDVTVKVNDKMNRIQRCKTMMSPKKHKNDENKKNNKQNVKVTDETKETIQRVLFELNNEKLSFLPPSLNNRFRFIVQKYSEIVSGGQKCILVNGNSNSKGDELIAEIAKCNSQEELCSCIISFIRRLYRLAKSYKQSVSCLENLSILCKMVQPKSKSKVAIDLSA